MNPIMMFPGLVRGLVGNSYTDGLPTLPMNEPGMSPKQYGIMLSRRRKSQRAKRRRKRRK